MKSLSDQIDDLRRRVRESISKNLVSNRELLRAQGLELSELGGWVLPEDMPKDESSQS